MSITDIKLTCTCLHFPTQYEGTFKFQEKNFLIYARYRWSNLSITIGSSDRFDNITNLLTHSHLNSNSNGVVKFEKEFSDENDITESLIIVIINKLFKELDVKIF